MVKFFFLIAVFGSIDCLAQSDDILIKKIESTKSHIKRCVDSIDIVSNCQLGLHSFHLDLFRASYDKNTQRLRLIGRVSLTKGSRTGMRNTSIILIRRPEWKISQTNVVGESSDDIDGDNDGFFDITVQVTKEMSLAFYYPDCYVMAYTISELLEPNSKD